MLIFLLVTGCSCAEMYSVSQKVPTFELSATCQILTDSQNFCTAGNRMKFATKLTHLTLGMLLQYLGKF